MPQGAVGLNLIGGDQGQVAVDAVQIFLFQVQALVAGIVLHKQALFFVPAAVRLYFIDHKSVAAGVARFGGAAAYICVFHSIFLSFTKLIGFVGWFVLPSAFIIKNNIQSVKFIFPYGCIKKMDGGENGELAGRGNVMDKVHKKEYGFL